MTDGRRQRKVRLSYEEWVAHTDYLDRWVWETFGEFLRSPLPLTGDQIDIERFLESCLRKEE